MPRTKKAIDEVGRPTSDAAQKIRDAKGQTTNLANNKLLAERASKYVSDIIARIEMSRTALNDKLTVLYGLWNGDSISDYFPTGRLTHVPEAYKAVEGFVPRARETLVGKHNWFRATGIDDTGKENAELIERLLKAQMYRDDFQSKFSLVLRDCAIYGFKPAKVRWKPVRKTIKYNEVKEKPVEEKEISGEEVDVTFGKEEKLVLDRPTMEPVDVFDFYADLRFHDIQGESPGVVFRQDRFEDELRNMAASNMYVNVEKLLRGEEEKVAQHAIQGPPGTALNPATYKELRNYSDGIAIDTYNDKSTHRLFEVFEFWGKFDPKRDDETGERGKEGEYVITLARPSFTHKHQKGGWVCLRIAENNYWHGKRPAIVAHFTRRSHCFQSVGMIEPISRLCAELDDSRSMALSARGLASKPVFVATDDADVYTNNLILDPGDVIRARTSDAIKPLHVPDRSDTAYKAEEAIKNDIREVTGIISQYQGALDAASETATSSMSRIREANKRIVEVCKNISEHFLVPMLEMFHAMNQQMITKERMVELVGEDGLSVEMRKVSPAEVAGKVNFEITCLPEVEFTGIKAQMYMEFLGQALQWMQVDPQIVRPAELMKMAFEEMFGTANIGRVFPSADVPIKMRSPMDEHYMFGMGYKPKVQQNENYNYHVEEHTRFTQSQSFSKWPEDAKRRLWAHIQSTRARLQAEMGEQLPRMPMDVMQQQAEANQLMNPTGAPQGQGPGGMTKSAPMVPGAPPGPKPQNMEQQVRSQAAKNAPKAGK